LRMEERTFSQLLDAVYDAATSFDRWSDVLRQAGDAFGCSYAGLIERNLTTLEGRAVAVGVDEASRREYLEVWSTRDTLRQWAPAAHAGAVETDRDILPREDLLRSDYYNGFMKPRDMHAVVRMTIAAEPGYRKIISMARPASRGDFGRSEVEQCRALVPHLRRAAQLMRRVEESSIVLTAFSGVLEQSATGVVLLDRNGRLQFANRAARTMAAANDSFTLRRDRIEALNGGDDENRLQRLIAAATRRHARADLARGGVMRLARRSGKPDLAIAVAPTDGETVLPQVGPAAFILICDPDVSATLQPVIRELFGLTNAEAQVAERLMQGETPAQAADALGVKTSTARWHLAALYRKTGTSRQAQLVRLLMAVPRI
jgi:DNA-binding CsgD family transcriptional regulator/PAS domain-containing protein